MKNFYSLFVILLFSAALFAQTPQKLNYQAIIRNTSDIILANQSIGIQISILQGFASGSAVYVETQNPTTNINGLITIEIGSGLVVSGDFSTINWGNDIFFIKTEIDITGGTNYTITGTSQLLSVPYALHAKTAETITGSVTETDPVYAGSSAFNITTTDITNLSNLSGINTGDQDISGIATNTNNISTNTSAIALNTAKVTNATHTGDVTGETVLTIGDGKVNDAKIVDVAATKITGTVAIANGGTGTSTAPTQYGVIYASSTSGYASTGVGTSGQVLISNGSSAPTWENSTAIKSPVIATLSSTPKTITNSTVGEFTGSSITLPPGKWSVQINMLLDSTPASYWLRTTFTDGSANSTLSADLVGGGLSSGYKPANVFSMLNGAIIINNTSGVNKTYYYWTKGAVVYSGSFSLNSFGTGIPGENQMIAYPMNN